MKKWLRRIEPIMLGAIGIGLYLLRSSPNLIDILNQLRATSKWELYLLGIDQLLFIYSIIFLVLGFVSLYLTFSGEFLLSKVWHTVKETVIQLKSMYKKLFRGNYNYLDDDLWILIILSIGILIRVYYLSQPIRADEAYSVIKYTNRDLHRLFYYELPNNHVLHNIFVKIAITLLDVSMFSIRLPAFIAGIGLIPITYSLSRSLNKSGILASIAVAVSPYLVFFSTNSRGYALLTIISIMVINVGVDLVRKGPSFPGSLRLSILSALGMLTMPSMLYAITGIFLWVLILLIIEGYSINKVITEFLISTGLMTIILSVLFYTPVIFFSNGIDRIINNYYFQNFQRDSWSIFLSDSQTHLIATFNDFVRDIPLLLLSLFFIFLSIGLFYLLKKSKDRTLFLLLPSLIIGSLIVYIAVRGIPFSRTWIFYIPVVSIIADAGYTAIIEERSKITRHIFSLVMVVGAVLYSLSLISSNSIAKYRDTGYFPEAEIAANYLKTFTDNDDRVFIGSPATWPTHYYLIYNDASIRYYDLKNYEFDNIYYLVQKSEYSIDQMTQESVKQIFEYNDLSIYQLIK